ncbi:MAG: leucine-rich repeat protein [Treponema sp.]|nr:leucine-rich repeat protein [Treponema sp.]
MRFYTSPVQKYRKIFKAINLRLFLNPILYLAVILVLASCSGLSGTYEEPVKDYFEKYTETAAIGRMENSNASIKDLSGTDCVSSECDKTLIFYMRNPRDYILNVKFLCAPDGTELADSDVQIEQDLRDRTVLRLTYSQSFLQSREGGGLIGGQVTLVESATLREFESYSFSLKCNTPPPGVEEPMIQIADSLDGSGREYVLCFFLPTTLLENSTHGNDTHTLHINDREFDPCNLTGGELTTVAPANLSPCRTNGPEFDASGVPSGYTVVYMYSGIDSGVDTNVTYTLYITDDDGLSSVKTSASNRMEKLAPPVLTLRNGSEVTAGQIIYIDGDDNCAKAILKATSTMDGNPVSGTKVGFQLSKVDSDYAQIADGTASFPYKKSPYTMEMMHPGSYTLTAFAIKPGYGTSDDANYTFVIKQLSELYVSETASSGGDGSKQRPFQTLQQAVNCITSLGNDSEREVRIFINGKVFGNSSINASGEGSIPVSKAKIIKIEKESGASEAVLDGGSNGTVLTIGTRVPVTIKDVKITKGKASNGGGLNIASEAKVGLVNVTVDENEATQYGGGIYNAGNVYLSGSSVIGKTSSGVATSSSYGNKAASSGAGVYNKSGAKLYLGYNIEAEESELTGGICKNYLANFSNSTALGGGIYNEGNIYFKSGNVSYNYAYNGGGIYTKASFEMQGGIIEGNEGGYDTGEGAGVNVNSGTFTMSGDSVIKSNCNVVNGGGVFLHYTNCKLVMNGGTISGNSATAKGGAVFMHDSTDSNHSLMQMKGSAYIPYGGAKKLNDVFILDTHSLIEITGKLTKTGTDLPVVTVTPDSYNTSRVVLSCVSSPSPSTSLRGESFKFAVTPETSGGSSSEWYICDDGTINRIMGVSLPKDCLSDFTPSSSIPYKITVDSTFGNEEVANLLSKISSSVGEGTILDLQDSVATSISTWIQSGVTKVILPNNINYLSSQFFQCAASLKEIEVSSSNTSFYSEDGVLYSKDKTILRKYPAAKAGDTFTLPNTVTKLYYQAFFGNKNLVKINGLTQIRDCDNSFDGVFSSCQKLETVDLSGLTCASISWYCFNDSPKIKEVKLSSYITTIEEKCFSNLSSLEKVYFSSTTPPSLDNSSSEPEYYRNFKSCPNVKFYVPNSAVNAYKTATGARGFSNPQYNGAATTTSGIQSKILGY